jgi:hypothetical protein
VLATIIGFLSLLVSTFGVFYSIASDSGGVGGAPHPMASPPPRSKVWPAEIVNTWSDKEQTYVGTFSRRIPDRTAPKAHSYNEQDQIDIKCAIPDGGPAETTVHGVTYKSEVWYLTSENDWLPSVFVKLLDQGSLPRQCRTDERPG